MKSTQSQTDWFDHMSNDEPKLVIPIGPRFQAHVPEWTGSPRKNRGSGNESDDSKWLGVVMWSMEDTTLETEGCFIGKGRPECCNCTTPGSIDCVKRHVSKKTTHLQTMLGPAFYKWRFDQMGESLAKLWEEGDAQRLYLIMRLNPFSGGRDFIKLALESFPSKSNKDIVNFYFNVYIPRRMSIETRSGHAMVNTDDEEDKSKSSSRASRKKARVDRVSVGNPKRPKARYLTGRR